jgi:GAF domain-containing protein/anti-sigma regulatory factor (Ser/Thr protein kinase)
MAHERMPSIKVDALSVALDEGGAALHAVLDAMPELAWTSTRSGEPAFFNRRWIEYTGDSNEAMIHPDDVASTNARWREAVATGGPFETEYRLQHARDKSYRWFLARALPLRDKSGDIRMWVGTATDIDAQKRANENLHFVMEASDALSSAGSVQAVCNEFARLATQRFADWCFIVLRDEDGQYRLSCVRHHDPDKVQEITQYVDRYPVASDPDLPALLEKKEPTLLPVITDEMLLKWARDSEHLRLLRRLGVRSAIVSPLRTESQTLGGILMYTAESQRIFDSADTEVLAMLTDRAAAALARQQQAVKEKRAARRLQFIGRAAATIYESLDLTATFGELVQLIATTFGGFAVAARIERGETVRVIAAAHSDPDKVDAARALIGVRPFHTEAEGKFIEGLREHKTVVRKLTAEIVARSTWPYLSSEMAELAPAMSVTIPLHTRDETYGAIVAYSPEPDRAFTAEEIEILNEIGRHASVAMENAQAFERERRMAQTLQDSLLPPSLPRLKGLRFDAVYLPSARDAQVGGDWYDAFVLEDGRVVVSTGDVTGRGPNAAVIMGKVRHLLAIAPSYESDPARILDTVESVLARRYPEAILTAFLGIIDADRRTMRFANAGHPHPLLRRKTSIEELAAEGLPVGLRSDAPPASSAEVDLTDARMLVLYTDGLIESTHDILAGSRRLHEVVQSDAVLHTHNPARFIEETCLRGAVDDDVAVLTLSFESSVRWAFDAENARAAQDARNQFMRYLRANAKDETGVAMAELIFGELVGNVVRHSPGAIDIDLDWSGPYPVLHVIDRGQKFALTGSLPKDLLSESGRGLFIVRNLSRNLVVEHVAGYGNHVIAELPVHRLFS